MILISYILNMIHSKVRIGTVDILKRKWNILMKIYDKKKLNKYT